MEKQLQNHDCSQFVEKVYQVLDGELTDEETELFVSDIERCKWCLEHYDIEKQFLEFVAKRFERKTCSETLKENILAKIEELSHT